MKILRPVLFIFVALVLALPSGAQDNKGFVLRVIDKLTAPSRELNPEAVYQPAPRWTFALTGDFRQAGITQNNAFKTKVASFDETGLHEEDVPALVSSKLNSSVNKGVGLQAGYGNLSLALSKTFGSGGTDNVFSFDYLSAGYAVQLQFFNLSHPVEYQETIAEEGHWSYDHEYGVTNNPGRLRASIVDAFYAFNRRTFAYSAAYKGNLFQKQSAGSWMLGGKLILSEFSIDPSELISLISGGQARHTSAQVSFGGGYSYNYVPFHRQPYGERDKGLRNLTVNLTFLPMVTFFNQFTATSYHNAGDGVYEEVRKDVMNGKLLVNYVSRIGIGYSYDLFTANLSLSNDSFSYKGTSSFAFFGILDNKVQTSGIFYRWTVALRLGMRF